MKAVGDADATHDGAEDLEAQGGIEQCGVELDDRSLDAARISPPSLSMSGVVPVARCNSVRPEARRAWCWWNSLRTISPEGSVM